MALNIEIKVAAPQAIPTINRVEQGLTKVEVAGARANDKLAKGFGNSSSAAEKAKSSTESLTEQMAKLASAGNAFKGLEDQFKREADMLEKIHGPAREFEADLRAMDGLMMKGSVTAEQYEKQLEKMKGAMGGAQNPAEKLGGALELIAMPAIGAGILEIGHKIADLTGEMERLEDEYTNLTNKALKFEDAAHNQSQVLDQMGQLGAALHTTREKAFEMFDTVKDGTDGMRVSFEQQVEMAKNFGLANALAGNGIESAADSMKRFMYDVQSGTVDVRALRQQMTNVPELAELWKGAFHTTENGLLEMAKTGKLTMADFAMAMVKPSAALDEMNEKAKRLKETHEQFAQRFAENVNVQHEQHGVGGFAAAFAAGEEMNGNRLSAFRIKYGNEAQERLNYVQAMEQFNRVLADQRVEWNKLGAVHDKAMHDLAQLPQVFGTINQAVNGVSTGVGNMIDEFHRVGSLKALFKELKDPWNHQPDAPKGGESLADQLEKQLNGPWRDFDKYLAAMNDNLDKGRISLDQYRDSLEKTINALPEQSNRPSSVVDGGFGPAVGQVAAVMNVPTPKAPPTTIEQQYQKYLDDVEKQRQERQAQSLTTEWNKQLEVYKQQAEKVNQAISSGFKPVVDGLTEMFETGSLNISKIGSDMEKVLAELAVKFVLFKALTSFGVNAGIVSSLTGFANGGDVAYDSLPHAANGFSGKVAGVGGTDTRLFAAMVSPGEYVSIRTPQQVAQRGHAPTVVNNIINKHDTRGELAAAFASGSMDTEVVNVMRRVGLTPIKR